MGITDPSDHAADELLASLPLARVIRIDVGLEGDWSRSVCAVWSGDAGFLGFDGVPRFHPTCRPALEFYFADSWVGIHCGQRTADGYRFDEARARRCVALVAGPLPGAHPD